MSKELLLGQSVEYRDHYDAGLLHPVPRAWNRSQLDWPADTALPFCGEDVWTGYELSWLNARGKPEVRIGEFRVPFDSPQLVESKSFKLYLNSFNGTRFDSEAAVRDCLQRDLSAAAGAPVRVQLYTLDDAASPLARLQHLESQCLDAQDIAIDHYQLAPQLLRLAPDAAEISESLHSHLLKSNCPVTGQPDWASVRIDYRGRKIDHAGLLAYLISFRNHAEFHEHCVERIFVDLWQRCQPASLMVYARYTRRGGLDINPFRSSQAAVAPTWRLARQ